MKKPSYGTKMSAGLDLLAQEDFTLRAHSTSLIKVGKIPIQNGYVGFVMPKSGLSTKHDIVARLGVIDADYKGDIAVAIDNKSDVPYTFEAGDKVAQLVVVPFLQLPQFEVIQKERGENGFGSTGK